METCFSSQAGRSQAFLPGCPEHLFRVTLLQRMMGLGTAASPTAHQPVHFLPLKQVTAQQLSQGEKKVLGWSLLEVPYREITSAFLHSSLLQAD